MPGGDKTLRIRFCHFRHNHLLSPTLFGFHLRDLDVGGRPVDPLNQGAEVSYAIVLNLAVDLQREVAILFVSQLIQRQLKLEAMTGHATQIDRDMEQQDIETTREIADRMRYGWQAGVELVRNQMQNAGWGLEARYEPDPLPDRDLLMRRIPSLKRIYNEFQEVKDTIDRLVSAIGGKEPRIGSTGPTRIRNWLQQRQLLLHFRYYMNHAVRDANVLGNGYFVFRQHEPLGAYNVEPERVWILSDGHYRIQQADHEEEVARDGVLHLRGIEQLESPYGISMLEVFLYHLEQRDVFDQVSSFASSIVGRLDVPSEAREWARQALEQSERITLSLPERISSMLWLPKEYLPTPGSDLYFPDHEHL
jgi:hypothetical protein